MKQEQDIRQQASEGASTVSAASFVNERARKILEISTAYSGLWMWAVNNGDIDCPTPDSCQVLAWQKGGGVYGGGAGLPTLYLISCHDSSCSNPMVNEITVESVVNEIQNVAIDCPTKESCHLAFNGYKYTGDYGQVENISGVVVCSNESCSNRIIQRFSEPLGPDFWVSIDIDCAGNPSGCSVVNANRFYHCLNEACSQVTSQALSTFSTTQGISGGGSMTCPTIDDCKIALTAGPSYLFLDCDGVDCATAQVTVLGTGVDAYSYPEIDCVSGDDCKVVIPNGVEISHQVGYTDPDGSKMVFIDCNNGDCSQRVEVILENYPWLNTLNHTTPWGIRNAVSMDCVSSNRCEVVYNWSKGVGEYVNRINEGENGYKRVSCTSSDCSQRVATYHLTDSSPAGGTTGVNQELTKYPKISCPSELVSDCRVAYNQFSANYPNGSDDIWFYHGLDAPVTPVPTVIPTALPTLFLTNTPTPTLPLGVSPTPTLPTTSDPPVSDCNAPCQTNLGCGSGLCFDGLCRNTACPADADCICSVPTPAPTVSPETMAEFIRLLSNQSLLNLFIEFLRGLAGQN